MNKLSALLNRVSTMKRTDFGDVSKYANRYIFSCVKGLLRTTRVQISAYIFRLPHGPSLGHTNDAHAEVY
jgi:hypothetical protein